VGFIESTACMNQDHALISNYTYLTRKSNN